MTLEDFFTLTEIKDGLTATSRVEELVSVMQMNKDSAVKNAGDASRQWAAVASTIAATKNKDCLDIFMQLDGLCYFSRWLSDAQRLSKDSTDSSIEESILALLQALENLHVDSLRSISSGVWHIVKNFLNHGSSRVRDLARKLFDRWKQDEVYDHSERENESISRLHEEDETRAVGLNGKSSGRKFHIADMSPSREGNIGETHVEVIDEVGSPSSGNSQKHKPDGDKCLEPQIDKHGIHSNTISNCYDKRAKTLGGAPTNEVTSVVQESFSAKEKCSMEENALTGTGSPLPPEQDTVAGTSVAPVDAALSRDDNKTDKHGSSENSGAAVAVVSSLVGLVAISSDSAVRINEEIRKEPFSQKIVVSNEEKRISSASDSICGLEDVSVTHNCSRDDMLQLTGKDNKCDADMLSGLSGEHRRHQKDETCCTSIDVGIVVENNVKNRANSKRRVTWRKKRNSRSTTVAQCLGAIDKATADIELGIVDALEVATKVAQEIAREVDSREPSCGSLEELSNESGQPDSPDSIVKEQKTPRSVSPSKEVLTGENHSVEATHRDHDHQLGPNDDKPENGANNEEAECSRSQVSPQPEVSAEKSPCDFDLNQEVYSDETAPAMSLVSVLRPVAAPGVPATPLQLERTLGWTGSAARSAFQPALPHSFSGGDLKEKQACLGIDLNVAEGGNDGVEDLTLQKLFPFSSDFRAAGTSQDTNRGESDRFNLDLNLTNDGDDAPPPSDLRMETSLFLTRNRHQISFPASYSSAQPAPKKVNIDLNDGPQILIDTYDNQVPYHGRHPWGTTPCRSHKSDEPVISIFGAKLEVNRKDYVPPVSSLLHNGKSVEPMLDLNMSRTGGTLGLATSISYQSSPIYGFNGLTAPPSMSMPLSSPLYVPGTSLQYMMDSRGAPVIMPQVVGSAPHIQQAYPHQQPFFMNMAGGSAGLNRTLPLQPSYDRSSGFGLEVGNRDSLSLRQFLSPGQGRPMGEHPGTHAAEVSSGPSIVGGKRKEPETGWTPYTLNSRPQYPPWR